MKNNIEIDSRAAATMVAVSRGYPGSYEKGFPIYGLKTEHMRQPRFSFRNPAGKRDKWLLMAEGCFALLLMPDHYRMPFVNQWMF